MTAAPPRRLRIAARCRPPRLPCPHRIACSTARCRRLCLADRGRTPPSPPAPSRSTTPHQRRLTLHCTSTSPGGCSSRPFPLPSGAPLLRPRSGRQMAPERSVREDEVARAQLLPLPQGQDMQGKKWLQYGNGFYLAMVDVNEKVSWNWSRFKVLLHLIC
ncbi:uncharacterized protein LOC120702383 isoform X2 [Panicum virgatum]|uniref:uncharacterized protein LOC120702383 isoform X2 n=1 Tax=Panicum virgatum TaxID=38727 RepID=UPI0019D697AF|nr:uncharacterized protein LOC120702383 isoform X2 [Panicum virgatum]